MYKHNCESMYTSWDHLSEQYLLFAPTWYLLSHKVFRHRDNAQSKCCHSNPYAPRLDSPTQVKGGSP